MRSQILRTVGVLVVEDNVSDAELVIEALDHGSTAIAVHHVIDGLEALEHLRSASPIPDLVLLDLNLPRMGGLETLEEIKRDPALAAIPVLVLTTSKSSREINQAYTLGAAAVLNKPMRLAGYRQMLAALEAFWLHHVLLPQDEVR